MTMSTPGASAPTATGDVRPTADVSRRTLDTTPERALKFIRTAAADRTVRRALEACGYTRAEGRLGWSLLSTATGFGDDDGEDANVAADATARDAALEIDASDERIFRITQASLRTRHPAQAAFVMNGIGPVRGPDAVLNMSHLLDRLDALESSPQREATRDADRAAIETLTKRGITPAERVRLRALVDAAHDVTPTEITKPTITEEQREAALIQLRHWYVEWADIARSVISRRDLLVRMGLASQRRDAEEEEEVVEPAAPTQPAPGLPTNGSAVQPANGSATPQ